MSKKIICVDFDGVIHWYRNGWQNGEIYDEPVPGAIEWLCENCDTYEINIYSSRSKDRGLLIRMKEWIDIKVDAFLAQDKENPMPWTVLDNLKFPTEKPPAWLTIDDRAVCFRGTFPSPTEIDNFKPWNK